jgi:hypothetical protein
VQKWFPLALREKSAPTLGAAITGLCALGVAVDDACDADSRHLRDGSAPSNLPSVQYPAAPPVADPAAGTAAPPVADPAAAMEPVP